jgi:hypothetical protein
MEHSLKKFLLYMEDKNNRIIAMLLYAIVMLLTIMNHIDMISFALLFIVLPVLIYYFVKTIFPNE